MLRLSIIPKPPLVSTTFASFLRLCYGAPSSWILFWGLRLSLFFCASISASQHPGSYPGVSDFCVFLARVLRLAELPGHILGSATSAPFPCGFPNSRILLRRLRFPRLSCAYFPASHPPETFPGVYEFRVFLTPTLRLTVLLDSILGSATVSISVSQPPGSYPGVRDFCVCLVPVLRLSELPDPVSAYAVSTALLRLRFGFPSSRNLSRVNLFSTVPLNAFGMYQVAFEMYPLETRVQMKFLVRGDPPHPHAFAMYLRMQGGEVRFWAQIPAVSYRYEGATCSSVWKVGKFTAQRVWNVPGRV